MRETSGAERCSHMIFLSRARDGRFLINTVLDSGASPNYAPPELEPTSKIASEFATWLLASPLQNI